MTEIVTVRGPLGEERLGWVASLYGAVDAKYASLDYVRHQFDANPFGWSVHAFVMEGERAVGHCAAVPFRAQFAGSEAAFGKIEAVVLAESHRGRRLEDGRSLAVAMLAAMYEAAHGHGLDLLFGLAPPGVSAVHARAGCERRPLTAPTYVAVATPSAAAVAGARRLAYRSLASAQHMALATAARFVDPAGRRRAEPRPLEPNDEQLSTAASPPADAWTVSGADAWHWYAGSGLLHAVETTGRFGARALVVLSSNPGADVQLVAWRPHGRPLPSAFVLLAALAQLAEERGARTLRFQPWAGPAGDGALTRACRMVGLVARPETELVLHARDAALLAADVQLTPFFYVTF